MLRRALLGLLKGVLVGGVLGLLCIYGLGMPALVAWAAYLFALLAGALTGLVAGRPIWAKGARIEAGLKAVAGAVLSVLAMFVIRKWLDVHIDLGALGKGVVGDLPIASLPLISTALAFFFEVDNTGGDPEPDAPKKARVEGDGDALRIDAGEDDAIADEEAEDDASEKARRH